MAKKPKTSADQDRLFPLLIESIDHMKLTPAKKDFARAVMRAAVEYVCMRRAGFVLDKPKKENLVKEFPGLCP